MSVYGFYTHAGQSYASTSLPEASSFLSAEVDAVNTAAGLALSLLAEIPSAAPRAPFVLAVGSTPTAHAATVETRAKLAALLNGTLELHAGMHATQHVYGEWIFISFYTHLGNYPLLDLQQLHTGLVDQKRVAQRVLATVISYYPGRGAGGTDEAMCDAGAIAMSKDTGPSGTFGEIVGTGWRLGRISQEHGTLVQDVASQQRLPKLNIGDLVQIVGQHACLTLAAHPWFYIVDSEGEGIGRVVEDVWVPWKGW